MKKILCLIILFILNFIIVNHISAAETYKIGDEVTYNNISFYVIEDSDIDDDTIILLKKELLTVEEVERYGRVGTENNHVNNYNCFETNNYCYRKVFDYNGYGGMAYYSSETCGKINGNSVLSGCTIDYNASDVKYVVDAWKAYNFSDEDIKEVRLLSYHELMDNLGYSHATPYETELKADPEYTPSWVYDTAVDYAYWTMVSYDDSNEYLFGVCKNCSGVPGILAKDHVNYTLTVRPVIELYKSSLEKNNDNQGNNNTINSNDNDSGNNTNNSSSGSNNTNDSDNESIIIGNNNDQDLINNDLIKDIDHAISVDVPNTM